MLKTERLIGILVTLLGKERISARELADKFEVSVRTILRDVEAINLAGIPIVTYQGANGGIGIAEGYRMDRSVLNNEEMSAVLSTLKGIDGAVSSHKYQVLIDKLKNSLSAPQIEKLDAKLNQIVIDLSPWQETDLLREKLAVLFKAIEDREELNLTYVDSQGSETTRRIEPYSLILKTQNWYLYAWCFLRSSFRYFRISRIRGVTPNGAHFKPRPLISHEIQDRRDWYMNGRKVAIELAFDEELENIVYEFFPENIDRHEAGRIIVKAEMPENRGLYGFLLSFGPGVEVLSPPHIRKILAEGAKEIYQKYVTEHDTQLSG